MPNFIVSFEQTAREKGAHLLGSLSAEQHEGEETLYRLFGEGKHWHALPTERARCQPALAVDGGSRRLELANGSLLLIAQALILGNGLEDATVDIDIVRGSVDRATADRFADLFLQRLEIHLAAAHVRNLQSGGMLLLDGALYSALPQLYSLRANGLEDPTRQLIEDYQTLFAACSHGCAVVSVAKSSRETLLSQLLQSDAGIPIASQLEMSDSEIVYRWTDDRAGFSTPVLLGKRSFTEGSSRALLDADSPVAQMHAIVSFLLRPEDYAPAWRVDFPATCISRAERLVDVEAGWVATKQVEPIIAALLADYGGPNVYHALLYTADQQVRLSTERLMEVYLPMLQDVLQTRLTPSLSSGRFVGWP